MTKARDNANNWAGDISAVTAGTGITGGGTSGDVTVNLDSTAVISPTIFDAKADLLTATANDTPARLAVGTNGQYLAANSATSTGLEWQTISAGGMTQLATGSLTGSSISLNSISGSYRALRLFISQFQPVVDDSSLRLRFNNNTATEYANVGTLSGTNKDFSSYQDFMVGSSGQDNAGTSSSQIVIDIFEYANNSTWKNIQKWTVTDNATSWQFNYDWNPTIYGNTTTISSIQLFCSSGDFSGGTYYLYGVK